MAMRKPKGKLNDFEMLGRWLFFVVLPWLLLALPRLLLWCFRIMQGHQQKRPLGLAKGFYQSAVWRRVRIECLERNLATFGVLTCELCYRTRLDGVQSFHCHHKKSRSKWPELALELENLAVCCDDCNVGMSNRYEDLDLNRCRRRAA